jgi:hypothetical protein
VYQFSRLLSKLTIVEKSTEVIIVSSGAPSENIEDDASSPEPFQSRTPSPEFDADLLMQVPTNITICQGRVPRLQGTSKTVKADISSVFGEFLDFVLQISKKKLGNKAPLLELTDLTVKYNWWCGKSEPKKLPQLYDLEDELISSYFRRHSFLHNYQHFICYFLEGFSAFEPMFFFST